jgi:hypothetical protein
MFGIVAMSPEASTTTGSKSMATRSKRCLVGVLVSARRAGVAKIDVQKLSRALRPTNCYVTLGWSRSPKQ